MDYVGAILVIARKAGEYKIRPYDFPCRFN
jgi:hypothetical protein